ncbi:flagellar basal body rod C-terminal domain-containing protein [Undibacterium flavidum]|uniref:flagellar basal body rod C-terminal domain-containing protein n=1 Tax=Undibacterium flavidum TaxID=2762297 RepID=UPI001C9B7641|nr:flagellar basal body rod C-terminal domain-containing protein [Undibacterium flavidum]
MAISSLNIGISGMKAYQGALDSSANNIANAQTKGYQPQLASFQENANGGVRVNISKAAQDLAAINSNAENSNADASGTDLSTELTNNLQYKAGFEFSAKVVKTADEIFATLLDLNK